MLYFSLSLVWLISKLAPRKNQIWVFGYGDRQSFTDNSKYLYLHTANNTNIRSIWLTKNKQLITELNQAGHEAYYYYSVWGMYFTARSNWGFITHSRKDIPWWLTGSMNIVRLHHGLPFKKFEQAEKDQHLQSKSKANRIFSKIIKDNYTYGISTSEYYSELLSRALNLSKNEIWETGYPRMDGMVGSIPGEQIQSVDESLPDTTCIFYFPTWRRYKVWPDTQTLRSLNNSLDQSNAKIYFRPHPYINNKMSDDYDNITFLHPQKDFYPILKEMDFLMTDYSSLFYDALYAEIPLIFYPADLEEYLTERELFFDYNSVPGFIINSPDELVPIIHNEFNHDEETENIWRDRTFNYYDGKNSKRVVEAVLAQINTGHCDSADVDV